MRNRLFALLLALCLLCASLPPALAEAEPEQEELLAGDVLPEGIEESAEDIELDLFALEGDTEANALADLSLDGETAPEVEAPLADEPVSNSASSDWVVKDGMLTKYRGSDTELVIPSDLGITQIGGFLHSTVSPYNNKYSKVTSVVVPEGVTTICASAFAGHERLLSIQLPSTLTTIEKEAFKDCTALSSITLPAGLEKIGEKAFTGCKNLCGLTIPAQTEIGEKAFYESRLAGLKLAEGRKAIPDYAFARAEVDTVALPKSLVEIGIEGLSHVKRISVPASVTWIDTDALCYCEEVTIAADFDNASEIMGGTKKVKVLGGMTECPSFAYCYSLTSLTLPNTITSLPNECFYQCGSLTELTLPSKVTGALGENTFRECGKLKALTIPNGVTELGSKCLMKCYSLEKLTLPRSVKKIADDCFEDCNLSKLTVCAPGGSFADRYTLKNDIDFEPTSFVPATSVELDCELDNFDGVHLDIPLSQKNFEWFLNANLEPRSADFSALKWKSSDPAVATVNQEGDIKVLKAGTTVVSVTTQNGLSDRVTVRVIDPKAPVTGVNFSQHVMYTGEIWKATDAVQTVPYGCKTTFKFKSSNKKVISVDSKGRLKAMKPGSATITVTTANGKKAKVKFTVKKNKLDNINPKPSLGRYGNEYISLKSVEIASPSKVVLEYYLHFNRLSSMRTTQFKYLNITISQSFSPDNDRVIAKGKLKKVKIKARGGTVKKFKVTLKGKQVKFTNLRLIDYKDSSFINGRLYSSDDFNIKWVYT